VRATARAVTIDYTFPEFVRREEASVNAKRLRLRSARITAAIIRPNRCRVFEQKRPELRNCPSQKVLIFHAWNYFSPLFVVTRVVYRSRIRFCYRLEHRFILDRTKDVVHLSLCRASSHMVSRGVPFFSSPPRERARKRPRNGATHSALRSSTKY